MSSICFLIYLLLAYFNSLFFLSRRSSLSLISVTSSTILLNSFFSILACSSRRWILYYSYFFLSLWTSYSILIFFSHYLFSLSLSALSLDSVALRACRASISACVSLDFSYNSLNLWFSFSFSSLIRFKRSCYSCSYLNFSLLYSIIFFSSSSSKRLMRFLC